MDEDNLSNAFQEQLQNGEEENLAGIKQEMITAFVIDTRPAFFALTGF